METSVDKCLAFCQSLVMSGKKFSFTLSIANSIGNETFSFNNKELESSSCAKKKSPSQIRRELKRKSERMMKKPEAESTEKVVEAQLVDKKGSTASSLKTVSKCSQCDSSFKSEEELKTHIGDAHTDRVFASPEKERSPDHIPDLVLTPIQGQRNEEDAMPSPPPFCVCRLKLKSRGGPECGKILNSEADFRRHSHEVHNICFTSPSERHCTWPGCS